MTNAYATLIEQAIADMRARPFYRAANELRDGFGFEDMQAIDATTIGPVHTGGDLISMDRQSRLPARGGHYSTAK